MRHMIRRRPRQDRPAYAGRSQAREYRKGSRGAAEDGEVPQQSEELEVPPPQHALADGLPNARKLRVAGVVEHHPAAGHDARHEAVDIAGYVLVVVTAVNPEERNGPH